MDKLKIARINELYKKSKTEGLTETEKEEQKQLRNEYRMAVINNLHSSLNNVSIENEKIYINIHLYVCDCIRVCTDEFPEFDVGEGIGEGEGGR